MHRETEREFLRVAAGRKGAETEKKPELLSGEAGVSRSDGVLVGSLACMNWSGQVQRGGVYLELMAIHRGYVETLAVLSQFPHGEGG